MGGVAYGKATVVLASSRTKSSRREKCGRGLACSGPSPYPDGTLGHESSKKEGRSIDILAIQTTSRTLTKVEGEGARRKVSSTSHSERENNRGKGRGNTSREIDARGT